jgi:hypothetical protein
MKDFDPIIYYLELNVVRRQESSHYIFHANCCD